MNFDKPLRKNTLLKVMGVTVLAFLLLVNVAGASPFAYITNWQDGTVSIIDTATNSVTANVKIAASHPSGVAVSPDGSTVYITDDSEGDGSVSAYHASSGTLDPTPISTAIVGWDPQGVAVSPDGSKIFVTSANVDPNPPSVFVIDAKNFNILKTVSGNSPYGLAVCPDGSKVYVTDEGTIEGLGYVSVINTTDYSNKTINTGGSPVGVAVSLVGKKAYVANSDKNEVEVIDTDTDTLLTPISVGKAPFAVAVSPDGSKAYVTNEDDNTVSIIDTVHNNIAATVPVGRCPYGIAVTPDGNKVYVTNNWDNSVSVIDTTNAPYSVVANVSVGNQPRAFGQFIVPPPAKPILPIFPGCTKPPQDLDNDGLYEDINGNGRLESADVVVFFKNTQWITDNGLAQYFDFNHDGRINSADVIKLFKMIH